MSGSGIDSTRRSAISSASCKLTQVVAACLVTAYFVSPCLSAEGLSLCNIQCPSMKRTATVGKAAAVLFSNSSSGREPMKAHSATTRQIVIGHCCPLQH
eukprot:scaffold11417_cov20-Tisochrysis_lutea.AAC.1